MAKATGCLGFFILGLALWVGYLATTQEDFFYRKRQSLKALIALSQMPKERIDNYVKAYEMFYLDKFTAADEHMQYVKDYYTTLNHLCSIGDYEKMYLPPVIDATKDTYSNQKLFEKRMASRLQVGPGKRVLDIGCGRGRVAHLVASETGAHVTGINIDSDQIESARLHAKDTGMADQLDFVEANYNNPLPFANASFDAVYYVQVFGGYGTDLGKFFREIFRVLKPGGRAHFEDYVALEKYNASNDKHTRYVQASKAILGVGTYYYDKEFLKAVKGSGLEVMFRQNASVTNQALLLEKDREFFLPLTSFMVLLNSFGLVPKHYAEMFLRLTEGTDDCIEAQRQLLVTGDIETLARKPDGKAVR